jgi:hypothetical protein
MNLIWQVEQDEKHYYLVYVYLFWTKKTITDA